MTQKSNGAQFEPGVLLDAATLRLERAVSLLESRVAGPSGQAAGPSTAGAVWRSGLANVLDLKFALLMALARSGLQIQKAH